MPSPSGPNKDIWYFGSQLTTTDYFILVHPALIAPPPGLKPINIQYRLWHRWYDDQDGAGQGNCRKQDVTQWKANVDRHEGATIQMMSDFATANTQFAALHPERIFERLHTASGQARLLTMLDDSVNKFSNTGPYNAAQVSFDNTDTPLVWSNGITCSFDFNTNPLRSAMRISVSVLCALLPLLPQQAASQLTQAECQAQATALGSGAPWGEGWERINDCGAIGSAALASAITNAASSTDSAFLIPLIGTSGSLRSAAIFDAAMGIVGAASATVPARVMATYVALAQWNSLFGPPASGTWSSLVTVPWGQSCRFGRYAAHSYIAQLSAPGTTQLSSAAATFATLANEPTTPAVVRDLARCARQALTQDVPEVPNISSQFIFLVYVCGTRFRVENDNERWVPVTWRVVGTTEGGGFELRPKGGGDFVWETTKVGTVELLYNGQVIQTRANGGIACPN